MRLVIPKLSFPSTHTDYTGADMEPHPARQTSSHMAGDLLKSHREENSWFTGLE